MHLLLELDECVLVNWGVLPILSNLLGLLLWRLLTLLMWKLERKCPFIHRCSCSGSITLLNVFAEKFSKALAVLRASLEILFILVMLLLLLLLSVVRPTTDLGVEGWGSRSFLVACLSRGTAVQILIGRILARHLRLSMHFWHIRLMRRQSLICDFSSGCLKLDLLGWSCP